MLSEDSWTEDNSLETAERREIDSKKMGEIALTLELSLVKLPPLNRFLF